MSAGTDYGTLTFQVRRLVLAQLADQALAAVPSREPSLAVYGCFRVTVAPGYLQLAATDMQLTVLAGTQAVSSDGSGTVFLPARRLKDILAAAPDGDVTVNVARNYAAVCAGKGCWDLKLPPPGDYPELIDPAAVSFAGVPREPLLAGLRTVRHAVCKDAGRPQHAQVQIAKDGEGMYATAYDGSQFCRAPVPGFPFGATVPAAMLDDLIRLCERSPAEQVDVGEEGSTLAVRAALTVLACQRTAREFPDVAGQVLGPVAGNSDELAVDRAELLRAVRRVAINANARTSAVALIAEGGALTVQTRDDDGNKAEEAVPASWGGARRLVVVNWRFLADMAAAHPGGTCVFRLGKDAGRRRSMVLLEDREAGVTGVIPQMQPASVGY